MDVPQGEMAKVFEAMGVNPAAAAAGKVVSAGEANDNSGGGTMKDEVAAPGVARDAQGRKPPAPPPLVLPVAFSERIAGEARVGNGHRDGDGANSQCETAAAHQMPLTASDMDTARDRGTIETISLPPPSLILPASPLLTVGSVAEEVAWMNARVAEIRQRLELIAPSADPGAMPRADTAKNAGCHPSSSLPPQLLPPALEGQQRKAVEAEARVVIGGKEVDDEVAALAARADDLREHLCAMRLKADLANVMRMVDQVVVDVAHLEANGLGVTDEAEGGTAREVDEVARAEQEVKAVESQAEVGLEAGPGPEPNEEAELVPAQEPETDEGDAIKVEIGEKKEEEESMRYTGGEEEEDEEEGGDGAVAAETVSASDDEAVPAAANDAVRNMVQSVEDDDAINTTLDAMLESEEEGEAVNTTLQEMVISEEESEAVDGVVDDVVQRAGL
jgi:hypothetical protein